MDENSVQARLESPARQRVPFWEVLGERAVGFTLVTAACDGKLTGFIGLSLAHVSANPPLLSVAIEARNASLPIIVRSGGFAVNFLSAGNEAVGRTFLVKSAPRDDRFRMENWTSLATGSPVLLDSLGAFDCTVERVVDLDHTRLLIGRVVESWSAGEGAPLIFFRGRLSAMTLE